MIEASTNEQGHRTSVFISYSRKDADFCARLAKALETRDYAPVYDKSEHAHDDPDLRLTAQDEWWAKLKGMIAASDVMVFIATPDSAASPVCDDEIAYAKSLGKRAIAILRSSIDFKAIPERLRAMNIRLDFRTDDQAMFGQAFDLLCNELELDIAWHREGARLARLADKWERDGRPEGQLLRAQAVSTADAWALRRPQQVTAPGELLLAFINSSREFEARERDRYRRLNGRAFVQPATQAVSEGRYDHALRLIATGALFADDLAMSLVPELWMVGGRAITSNQTRTILRGHIRSHVLTSFSADGRLLLTAASDARACVWDSDSGNALGTIEHANGIESASFSPNGQWVVTADGVEVAVWEARTGRVVIWLDCPGAELASFSPVGDSFLSTCSDGAMKVWHTETGAELLMLRGHGQPITTAAFSADGRRIVMGCRDGNAGVWDAVTGAQIARLSFHGDSVTASSFSPNGQSVLTASKDGIARVWHAKTGKKLVDLQGHSGAINVATFSADGSRIVTGSEDGTGRVWNAADGSEIACVNGHGDAIATASFSPDGRRFVTGSWNINADWRSTQAPTYSEALIWDADTGERIARLAGHDDGVCCASFSPDGRRLVTGSEDGTARVWDAHSGPERARLKIDGHHFTTASFSPDATRIVTGSEDGTARVWDAGTLAELVRLDGHKAKVTAAFFHPDAKRILTASKDGTARIWDADTGFELLRFSGHSGAILTASYSPDGGRVVTGSEDGTARVWSADSASEIARFVLDAKGSVTTASFSPDGRSIVSTENIVNKYPRFARIWDADSGLEIQHIESPLRGLWSASLSPDGKHVVVIGGDKRFVELQTASIIDARTGSEVIALQCRNAFLNGASFSLDGQRIVTATNPVGVFDADTGAEIARLEGHTGRVSSATFSPDGRFVVTTSTDDHSTRIWDVSNTMALCLDRRLALVASLSAGLGGRSEAETTDLLMQDAPDELFVAAKSRLETNLAHELEAVIQALRAPRHAECYLSPTQRSEAFARATSSAAGAGHEASSENNAQRKFRWPFG